jgi:dihydroxy-acid dehydratase
VSNDSKRPARSRLWFDDPGNPKKTGLYLERYLNYGLTRAELQSGRPIIGIAQTGSDLVPCNRHLIQLAERVRDCIRDGGGVPLEFPVHPLQETGKRPTTALDRNLAYLSLVEVLYGYPLDGVVLTTGCDKTTPASFGAAITVNIPAIVLSGGPMLNGYYKGSLAGSGTVIWEARRLWAAGEIGQRISIQTQRPAPAPQLISQAIGGPEIGEVPSPAGRSLYELSRIRMLRARENLACWTGFDDLP